VLVVWVESSRHRQSDPDLIWCSLGPVLICVQSSPAPPSDTSQERQSAAFRGFLLVGGPSVLVAVMAVALQYYAQGALADSPSGDDVHLESDWAIWHHRCSCGATLRRGSATYRPFGLA